MLDDKAHRVLALIERTGRLDDERPPGGVHRRPDRPRDRPPRRGARASCCCRTSARRCRSRPTCTTLAVIGPNADAHGDPGRRQRARHAAPAGLAARRAARPLRGGRRRGRARARVLQLQAHAGARSTGAARRRCTVEYFAGRERAGEPVYVEDSARGLFTFIGPVGHGVPDEFSLKVRGTVVAPEIGRVDVHARAGRPGEAVDRRRGRRRQLESDRPQRRVHGLRQRARRRARSRSTAGEPHTIEVEFVPPRGLGGLEIGCRPPSPPDLMDRAVALARRADAVVCVVGTDNDWETEGNDRESMALPPPQDELVRAVAAANPRTVVVVNAASPVEMPWADDVAAIVQAWFPGEEWGNALADVLSGDVSPSGKLPTTIPVRLEDTPAFTNYPGERGQVRYGEGVFVGYRWYDTRRIEPRFCFGHGLSYTTFELGAADVGRRRGARARDEHGHGARRGNGAVLRARRRGVGRAPAAGAEGVRQGVARSRASRATSRSRSTTARSRSGTSPRTRGRPSRASSSCASARRRARSRTASRSSGRDDHAPTLTVGLANFGATFPPGEWKRFVDLGRAAEDAGIDRIVVVDHVVMGPHTENYVWGKFPVPPDAPWFEPLTMLDRDRGGHRRACGSRPASSSRRCGPPRSSPSRSRRSTRLSGGRVDLGVGTGWQREEYDAQGLDFEQRGSAARRHARRVPGAVARHARRARRRRRSRSATSTACPSRCRPGGVPIWVAGTLHAAQPRAPRRARRGLDPDHGRDRRRHRRRRAAGSATRSPPRAATRRRSRCRRRCAWRRATTAGPTSPRAWRRCPISSPRARPTCIVTLRAFARRRRRRRPRRWSGSASSSTRSPADGRERE